MPPRVFMPIRHRRRPSEIHPVDPLVKRMTRGSLLIGLGFLVILAGVLVTIFAMKPKSTTRYRRPMRTFAVEHTPPPFRTNRHKAGSGAGGAGSGDDDAVPGLSVSMVLGPVFAFGGVSISVAGAIFYAVNYQRKKQKDKEASRPSGTDEEAAREASSPLAGSPSAVNLAGGPGGGDDGDGEGGDPDGEEAGDGAREEMGDAAGETAGETDGEAAGETDGDVDMEVTTSVSDIQLSTTQTSECL